MGLPRPPNPAWHEASRRGDTRYISDRVCIRGHVGERYVLNGACVVCVKAYSAEYQAKHPKPKKPPNAMREEALANGRATFKSGIKCSNGHSGTRYTKTNGCVGCVRARHGRTEDDSPHSAAPGKTLRLPTGKSDHPAKIIVYGTDTLDTIRAVQEQYSDMLGKRPTKALVLARALQMCAEILKVISGDEQAVKAERAKLEALSTPPKTTQEPLKENSNAYHH